QSDCILHRKSNWQSLLFLYRKHGWRYFLFKITDQLVYAVTNIKKYLPNKRETRLFWEAEKRKIPIITIKDINSPQALEQMKTYAPDIIISYFNQILKEDALALPRLGCLNVHPGYLPVYRGVASSFWAMQRGANWGGVTVHFMEKKLDTGDIVGREKVAITKDMSLHRHNYLCCKTGGILLLSALKKLRIGKIKRIKQKKGDYYSWPDAESVEAFHAKGLRLIDAKDLELY
ncbi:hypothetical protein A2Y99_05065, partial [Candidatus Gottesmanbacteria bacterium RBG_13_37_7]